MRNSHGEFIWYELMTTDATEAKVFYGGLALDWTFSSFEQDDMPYEIFAAGGPPVGGLMSLTQEMQDHGARPVWAGYVGVDDVDASAKAIANAGGEILMEPWDIPGVGRLAFLTDPQGVKLYIMRGESDEASESFSTDSPRIGHCAWNELMTSDPANAQRFYGDVFGWVKHDSIDMGPGGEYEMFKSSADLDYMFGGMMRTPDGMPASMWTFYFRVASIAAAEVYVKANGGTIVSGPMEIPGGERVFSALDLQGAVFSLIGH